MHMSTHSCITSSELFIYATHVMRVLTRLTRYNISFFTVLVILWYYLKGVKKVGWYRPGPVIVMY